MELISDRTGILKPQEATTFIDRFLQSIHARITAMEGEEALRLLHDIWRNLDAEESAVDRSVLEIEEMLHRLASVSSSEELGVITARFHQLAAEQFRKRASVGTYHSHYSRFMELLISHATTSAADMLQKEGTEIRTDSWCVLVSGKLGRNEPSKMHLGRVILLADDSAEFSREVFNQLAYRTMAILELLLPPKEKKLGPGRHQLWAGTATNWRELVDTGLSGGKSSSANIVTPADADLFEETFRLVADLRPLCGSMPLAEAAIVSSRARVARNFPERGSGSMSLRRRPCRLLSAFSAGSKLSKQANTGESSLLKNWQLPPLSPRPESWPSHRASPGHLLSPESKEFLPQETSEWVMQIAC